MHENFDALSSSITFRILDGRLGFLDRTLPSAGFQHHEGPVASSLLVGSVVDSKYKVLSLLGEGGMGVVFHVIHQFLKKEMALKIANLNGDSIALTNILPSLVVKLFLKKLRRGPYLKLENVCDTL